MVELAEVQVKLGRLQLQVARQLRADFDEAAAAGDTERGLDAAELIALLVGGRP